jgi:hypothetical protein
MRHRLPPGDGADFEYITIFRDMACVVCNCLRRGGPIDRPNPSHPRRRGGSMDSGSVCPWAATASGRCQCASRRPSAPVFARSARKANEGTSLFAPRSSARAEARRTHRGLRRWISQEGESSVLRVCLYLYQRRRHARVRPEANATRPLRGRRYGYAATVRPLLNAAIIRIGHQSRDRAPHLSWLGNS